MADDTIRNAAESQGCCGVTSWPHFDGHEFVAYHAKLPDESVLVAYGDEWKLAPSVSNNGLIWPCYRKLPDPPKPTPEVTCGRCRWEGKHEDLAEHDTEIICYRTCPVCDSAAWDFPDKRTSK